MPFRIVLVGILVLAAPACGGADDRGVDADTHEDDLLGAPLDDRNRTWSVGICTGVVNTDPNVGTVGTCRRGTSVCSGTLIAQNLVLTARHCVHQSVGGATGVSANPCGFTYTTVPVQPGGTRVTTAPSVRVGSPKFYDVAEVIVPAANRGCADDLAVLRLADSIPLSEAAHVSPDFRDLARFPPRAVAIAGRGAIGFKYELDPNGDWTGGVDVTAYDRGDFLRRVAQSVPFLCASRGDVRCTTLSHEVPQPRVFTLPEEWMLIGTAAAPGDSGSGVFDQRQFTAFGGRFPRLLGVLSWGFIGSDGSPKDGGVVRLDRFRELLVDAAWGEARKGRYGVPEWARDPAGGS